MVRFAFWKDAFDTHVKTWGPARGGASHGGSGNQLGGYENDLGERRRGREQGWVQERCCRHRGVPEMSLLLMFRAQNGSRWLLETI